MNLKPCIALAGFLLCGSLAQAQPAIDPDEGRLQIDWQDAEKAIGKVAFVTGKVVGVGRGGRVSFINFDEERPPKFVAVVFEENLANFDKPLATLYDGKIVRIRGQITTYRDRPQIVVTQPDQIEVLDEMPNTEQSSLPAKPIRRDADPNTLRIATYNALNLFDDVDDAYRGDESTPSKPREQLTKLADSIRSLDADIVALQEVENRGYLERFIEAFLPEMGYDHVVHFEGNDLRGIDVCLISRLPIGPVRSHRHLTFTDADGTTRRFNRDLLVTTVQPEGAVPVDVWVVHLKSNSGGRKAAEPIRLAEAAQLRQLLDAALKADSDSRILVMGDFNDTWESETLRTIVGNGSQAMWCPAGVMPGERPVTYNQGEFKSMIDFILASPAMAREYVSGSYVIPPGSPETTGSDHNPVVAEFTLR